MSAPELITSISRIRELARQAKRDGTLALVPTMGALHDGHLSLVRTARNSCNTVVVSIFVNPTQFAPGEDFTQYPRTLDEDVTMLSSEGVEAVFAPSVDEMYPRGGGGTFVDVPDLANRLDGLSRPGHFRGVASVVAKLFNIVTPDAAFFGQKDAAQVAVIKAMVRDLNFPLTLHICPTVRDSDGLAMSSRNRYLSASQRTQSLALHHSLRAAETKIREGLLCAGELREIMRSELGREPAAGVEYAEVVDPDTLLPLDNVSHGALLAIAARIGKTRLIDNLLVPRSTEKLMRVMLGVCGSIAAYKAAELVRLLQQRGIDAEVAMTRSARRFLSPLTFASLTGRTVHTSLWQRSGEPEQTHENEFSIDHITSAQEIEALVIAPATATTIAKLAGGVADDFISAMYLATKARVFIAPAMNVNMWQHPATQANVKTLRDRGARFIEPDEGYLACGMTGSGRLASADTIIDAVLASFNSRSDLCSETILITAGGTREAIDPVRFVGNRSSGRMGYALAEEAISRGARVILITASALPAPAGCDVVHVETAAEMSAAVLARLRKSTIVIKAAAVADYRVRAPLPSKLRRSGPIALALIPTEDIVANVVAQRQEHTLVIAFAAETENVEANARAKLLRKGADAIVANDVSANGIGFDSERNAGMFITEDSMVPLPESSKREMAARILDQICMLRQKTPGSSTQLAHRA